MASSLGYGFTYASGNLAITPAPLTVTANSMNRSYGSINPALGVSYNGFKLGQDQSVLGGTLNLSTAATQASDVGNYAINVGGYTNGNYTVGHIAGNLAINPASLTVTADNQSRLYGSANPALTASYSGFVLGQDESILGGSLTLSTPAVASSNVGSYAITASGLSSTNYTISHVGGLLDVTPAALTVTADNKSRLYGASNPTFTASYSGFVLGQDESVLGGALDLSTPAVASSNVGNYGITASGLTSSNYDITHVDGDLEINPAPLTVAAQNVTYTEGSTPPAYTALYSGFVLGHNQSVLGGSLQFSASPVVSGPGLYQISPLGLTSSNYQVQFVDGQLIVAPPPTISTNNTINSAIQGLYLLNPLQSPIEASSSPWLSSNLPQQLPSVTEDSEETAFPSVEQMGDRESIEIFYDNNGPSKASPFTPKKFKRRQ